MSFLSAFNICASGLTAQRKRLDVASENLANSETTRTESGDPYRRKMVVLQEIQGGFPPGAISSSINAWIKFRLSVSGVLISSAMQQPSSHSKEI